MKKSERPNSFHVWIVCLVATQALLFYLLTVVYVGDSDVVQRSDDRPSGSTARRIRKSTRSTTRRYDAGVDVIDNDADDDGRDVVDARDVIGCDVGDRDGGRVTVAVGGAITSRRLNASLTADDVVASLPLFRDLLPSFCRTATPTSAFAYRFYFAHDVDDEIFETSSRRGAAIGWSFRRAFDAEVRRLCPRSVNVGRVRVVRSASRGLPARAQNDAMMAAYVDGVDYFYRLNDDTVLTSADWTTELIGSLRSHFITDLGVVGPAFCWYSQQRDTVL